MALTMALGAVWPITSIGEKRVVSPSCGVSTVTVKTEEGVGVFATANVGAGGGMTIVGGKGGGGTSVSVGTSAPIGVSVAIGAAVAAGADVAFKAGKAVMVAVAASSEVAVGNDGTTGMTFTEEVATGGRVAVFAPVPYGE